jgi:GNAT superfamily N-acetyltransferase
MTRFATMLWHRNEPIGICVFVSPPLSLAGRNRFFGSSGRWDRTRARVMNRRLVMLSRVVIHPTYRGAGIAAAFVRRSCEACPYPWIETLAGMGNVNPFFEKAGFVRVPVRATAADRARTRRDYSKFYGGRRHDGRLVSQETFAKSRHSRPVYYIFDNRTACETRSAG